MADEDKTVIAELGSIATLGGPLKKKTMASLVQYNGAALGKRYPLEQDLIKIGRSMDAQVTIAESSVSRIHAQLLKKADTIYIEDAGSANGTFVNEQKVTGATPLKDQDMIRLGTVMLKFFSSDNIDGYIQDKIYRMATIDAGTQIFNKQYLQETLANEFKFSKSSGRPLSIIYFDLDFFKKVNDSYGHNAGDHVLKEIAQIVKGMIRKDDILARFGGEEFIVVLPNTVAQTACELGERVRKACEGHVFRLEVVVDTFKQYVDHKQTISIGISQLSAEMQNPKDLLESADKKLYTSKQGGRNRITI